MAALDPGSLRGGRGGDGMDGKERRGSQEDMTRDNYLILLL